MNIIYCMDNNEAVENEVREKIEYIKKTYYSIYNNISKKDLLILNRSLKYNSYHVEDYYNLRKNELKYETLKKIDLLYKNLMEYIDLLSNTENNLKYFRNIKCHYHPFIEILEIIEKRTKKNNLI